MGLGASSLGFAAQAKEMQRFFAIASTAGSLGASAGLAACSFVWFVSVDLLGREPMICTPEAPWCLSMGRAAKPMLGRRGLGVLVLAGVLIPVSLVRSAVEAREIWLVMDRRRREAAGTGVLSGDSPSEALCKACVRSEAWFSLVLVTDALLNCGDAW